MLGQFLNDSNCKIISHLDLIFLKCNVNRLTYVMNMKIKKTLDVCIINFSYIYFFLHRNVWEDVWTVLK